MFVLHYCKQLNLLLFKAPLVCSSLIVTYVHKTSMKTSELIAFFYKFLHTLVVLNRVILMPPFKLIVEDENELKCMVMQLLLGFFSFIVFLLLPLLWEMPAQLKLPSSYICQLCVSQSFYSLQ